MDVPLWSSGRTANHSFASRPRREKHANHVCGTLDNASCKKNGCNWKNEQCIPHKINKKVKCKKLNKGVIGKETICSCFKNGKDGEGCTFDWKTKKGKKVKKSCLGTFKWKKPLN